MPCGNHSDVAPRVAHIQPVPSVVACTLGLSHLTAMDVCVAWFLIDCAS